MKRREFIKYSALLLGSSAFARDLHYYALHAKCPVGVRIIQEPYQTIASVLEQLFPPNIAMPTVHSFNVIGFFSSTYERSSC